MEAYGSAAVEGGGGGREAEVAAAAAAAAEEEEEQEQEKGKDTEEADARWQLAEACMQSTNNDTSFVFLDAIKHGLKGTEHLWYVTECTDRVCLLNWMMRSLPWYSVPLFWLEFTRPRKYSIEGIFVLTYRHPELMLTEEEYSNLQGLHAACCSSLESLTNPRDRLLLRYVLKKCRGDARRECRAQSPAFCSFCHMQSNRLLTGPCRHVHCHECLLDRMSQSTVPPLCPKCSCSLRVQDVVLFDSVAKDQHTRWNVSFGKRKRSGAGSAGAGAGAGAGAIAGDHCRLKTLEQDCPICLSIFKVPVIARCGLSFCKSCITKLPEICSNVICPVCRCDLSVRDTVRNYSLEKLIRSIGMSSVDTALD